MRTPDAPLSKLQSQRSALQERLSAASKQIERLDGLEDVTALVAALDERQTLESALALLDQRIEAATAEARQAATDQAEAERLRARQAEAKTYASALAAVVGDVQRLDASLQKLGESRRRLAGLGESQPDGGAVAALVAALAVARRGWRIGLPERDLAAEARQAAIADAEHRLETAERRRAGVREFVKEFGQIPATTWADANDAVRLAKKQLALLRGQVWTPADEAGEQRGESLTFTPRRSPAELEQLAIEQNHRFAANRG